MPLLIAGLAAAIEVVNAVPSALLLAGVGLNAAQAITVVTASHPTPSEVAGAS